MLKRRSKLFCLILSLTLVFSLLMIPGSNVRVKAAAKNLLINGDAEEGTLNGWVDKDGCWAADTRIWTTGSNFEGKCYFWPKDWRKEQETVIYQDVAVTSDIIGKQIILSSLLVNYDQSPHDQTTLRLEFLSKNGKVLASHEKSQRNPQWMRHIIAAEIPDGAVTARVSCIADRFAGSDNDAYFDDMYLVILKDKFDRVFIIGNKDDVKVGSNITLIANNGKTTNASAFEWYSSYEALATVNAKGVVVVHDEGEVVIYAKDKETGITGSYYINSKENKNETPAPDKVKNVKKSKVTKSSITLKWSAADDCTGYYLYMYKTSSKKYEKVKTIKNDSVVNAKISGLKAATAYKFKVVAYTEFGGKVYKAPASKVVTISTQK